VTPEKAEAIIANIAAKHGIALGRDDPVLILHTLNERLLEDSAAAQEAALEHFRQELEAIAQRWGEDARGKAEKTLNAALAVSRDAMMKGMQAGAKAAAASARQEIEAAIEAAIEELAGPIRDGRRIAVMNLIAAAMAVVAAALVLLSTR
jgi:hypothetical protein